jgi:ABC-type transport system substrate-binding protein
MRHPGGADIARRVHIALATVLLAFVAHDAALAADPAKVLRVAFTSAEMSLDPQFSADAATDGLIDHVFESMLDYDYLVRPPRLVPRTLVAMPTVEDAGATYVFRFRRGIWFTPDAAFKGAPRELTAADQAYAIKRLLDPAVKSPWLWLVGGKVVGADEARARALETGRFDYDTPIRGIEIVDRYTLRLRLAQPDLRFLYAFAIPNTAPVAKSSKRTARTSGDTRSAPARTCSRAIGAAPGSSSPRIRVTATRRTRPQAPCRPSCSRSHARSPARSCRLSVASTSRSSRKETRFGSHLQTASWTC